MRRSKFKNRSKKVFLEHLNKENSVALTNANFANLCILLNFLIKQKISKIMVFREFGFSLVGRKAGHDNSLK